MPQRKPVTGRTNLLEFPRLPFPEKENDVPPATTRPLASQLILDHLEDDIRFLRTKIVRGPASKIDEQRMVRVALYTSLLARMRLSVPEIWTVCSRLEKLMSTTRNELVLANLRMVRFAIFPPRD